ncbi:MAG: hypothetical protein Q8M94_16295 [Ignavibacteria bacterium]|nr:hypothetical protein [Ignavibacteria bacterium]
MQKQHRNSSQIWQNYSKLLRPGKTLSEDIISYVVRFGFLGQIVNTLVISKKINKILNYRR